MTRTVKLTKGKVTTVSNRDYARVAAHKWHAKWSGTFFYATGRVDGKETYMHRFILDPLPFERIDHADGDALNNTRGNIRICTASQNSQNSVAAVGKSSKYKGVYWYERVGCWIVQIKDDGSLRTVHGIRNELTAAKIYDLLAVDRWGEFACPNFPVEGWKGRTCQGR